MRRTSPGAWMTVAFIAAITVVPVKTGFLIIKAYRLFFPKNKSEALGALQFLKIPMIVF